MSRTNSLLIPGFLSSFIDIFCIFNGQYVDEIFRYSCFWICNQTTVEENANRFGIQYNAYT